MKKLTNTFVAIAIGAAIAAPAAFAGNLSAQQIAEERANLHADGSLPFVHSSEVYGKGVDDTIYTDERVAELDNLHADGSLPFVHSADAFGDSVAASDVIWTEAQIAEFQNLRSDGSLL